MVRPRTRTTDPERFNCWLEEGDVKALRQLAKDSGFIVTTGGPYQGQGSIAGMLKAMAENHRKANESDA